jgi:nudix-type nucleoside diphosphatase (YffH/AdpP family)
MLCRGKNCSFGVSGKLAPKESLHMAHRRRVDIDPPKPNRLLDAFFKVDEYRVSWEQYDGHMSPHASRLNFERGDAVGVLLFNVDTRSVVLVEQFKLPSLIGRRRDNPATHDGWIVEVMAGMIQPDETPEQTAVRETMEETGYEIENPELICKFLSSPGGTSERIFLYFAKVTDSKRPGKDNIGVGAERKSIRVMEKTVNDLFEELKNGQIDDPKLAIAAYWLKDNMARVEMLDPATVKYEVVGRPGLIVGYKTGDIKYVKGVDVWVNGENTDMMMDRFIGESISARIRAMGANKKAGDLVDDTIQEALHDLMGDRAGVDIGAVLITQSGALGQTNDVHRIFHVAAVKGVLGQGAKPDQKDLMPCAENVISELERENKGLWRRISNNTLSSILFPLMGAGEGGLPVRTVAEGIIPAAINYFTSTPNPTVKEIYFLAFRLRERNACEAVLSAHCGEGKLRRLSGTAGTADRRLEGFVGQAV